MQILSPSKSCIPGIRSPLITKTWKDWFGILSMSVWLAAPRLTLGRFLQWLYSGIRCEVATWPFGENITSPLITCSGCATESGAILLMLFLPHSMMRNPCILLLSLKITSKDFNWTLKKNIFLPFLRLRQSSKCLVLSVYLSSPCASLNLWILFLISTKFRIHCNFRALFIVVATELWSLILCLWGKSWVNPISELELLECWEGRFNKRYNAPTWKIEAIGRTKCRQI